jgi:hypothetical protein
MRMTRSHLPMCGGHRPFRGRRRLLAGFSGLLGIALVAAGAVVAEAEDAPTSLELLDKCGNGTDYCQFHVSGPARTYWKTADLVGQTANCTDSPQNATLTWEHTTTSTNSLGTALSVSAGAGSVFSIAVKVSYQHDWTTAHTQGDATQITIPAHQMGRVFDATQMEEVSGQYEMHFGDRYYGHYYWYLPMTVNSPVGDDPHDNVTTRSDPLTAEETATYCSS